MQTEWVQVEQPYGYYTKIRLYSQVGPGLPIKSGAEWMDPDFGSSAVEFKLCDVPIVQKYTHHLCEYHDIILINEKGIP